MLKTFAVSVLVSTLPQSDVSERHVWDVTVQASTALDAVDRARDGIGVSTRETPPDEIRAAREARPCRRTTAPCDDLIPALTEG